jgi:hypothetical protein
MSAIIRARWARRGEDAMKSFIVGTIVTLGIGLSTAGEQPVETAPAAMPELPTGARDWDEIGRFTLKDGTKPADVWLYYSNTNAIHQKRAEREGAECCPFTSHPFCEFHAIYRIGNGSWQYRNLLSGYRTGFDNVAEIRPEMIRIRLCSLIVRWPGDPEPEPWTKILKLTDGVPVLVADNPRKL